MNRKRRVAKLVLASGCAVFLAAAAAPRSAHGAEILDGRCVNVVDGDTVDVEISGETMRVELTEIDAPETGQPYGAEARAHLSDLVLDKEIEIMVKPVNGVNTARIRVDKQEVALLMLEAGYAWTADTEAEKMILAMMRARGESAGLWAGADPVPPLVWRSRKPPTPTPVPVEVARSLSDAGRKVELEKNADGKTVIAGLPMIEPGSQKAPEATETSKDLKTEFECAPDGIDGCVESKFKARFSAVYEGDSPGSFTRSLTDNGEGKKNYMFQGLSTKGRSFAVGAACFCKAEAKKCQCVIKFGKLEDSTSTTTTAEAAKAE